jgi:O-antigen/teichoic acid export membrane protein
MQGLRRLVLRNLSYKTAAEIVALACGLASTIILSRYLDIAGFGAFNYAFAFMYLFLSLNDLGVNTIVIREVSQAPARAGEIIGAAIALRLTIAGAVLAAAWAAIWLWPMDPSLRMPLSLFALILPLNALNVPGMIFFTAMRFEYNAISTVVLRVSGLALIALAVAAGLGVTAVLGGLLVSEVIGLVVVYRLARPLVRFHVHVDRGLWRVLLRSALPVGAALLLAAIVNRIDFVMLEQMVSLEAVGLYSAAYRITNLLEKFPLFVMAALYPIMSQLASADPARLRDVYRKTVAHFAVLGVPLGVVTTIAAPHVLALLFGEEYRAAGGALRYLVWSTVCLYLALAGGNLLLSVGRERDSLLALSFGAVVNVALNFMLIPTRGIEGAAIATAVSFAIVLVITSVAVERYLRAAAVPA